MKVFAKVFILIVLMSMLTACCDRRCKMCDEQVFETIKAQEKLVKMKEQVVDKGSK